MDTPTSAPPTAAPAQPRLLDRKGQLYEPAISPRLKYLLALIFFGFALLGASGAYMAVITLLNNLKAPTVYTNFFKSLYRPRPRLLRLRADCPVLPLRYPPRSSARFRRICRAVRLGLSLFVAGTVVCLSGLALMQVFDRFQLPPRTLGRTLAYVLHVGSPFVAVALYVLHRRAGPDIQWRWGVGWGVCVSGFLVAMVAMHSLDPRRWYQKAPAEGEKYFYPSDTARVDGKFVSARTFDDGRVLHEVPRRTFTTITCTRPTTSARSTIRPTCSASARRARLADARRNVRASRWCAGCHDLVPFFSGEFDDPHFDDEHHPTAQGRHHLRRLPCHHATSTAPRATPPTPSRSRMHYPFAYSDNPLLHWFNNQLIKAKPDFHKKTFLKPFHNARRSSARPATRSACRSS